MQDLILNLSCPDRPGIVAAVSSFLAQADINIAESHQFGDPSSGQFFMRIAVNAPDNMTIARFTSHFDDIAAQYDMRWAIYDAVARPRVLIMVSKFDHCLHDLIYRTRAGSLKMDIAAIVSNHQTAREAADHAGLAYHYWQSDPHNAKQKADNETRLADLIEAEGIELIILARYMQILSPAITQTYAARIINIHHSFLPSFKGAEPYSRAYQRGVKMIGATAHFVTAHLDEGPIITQGVAAIRHDMQVAELIDVGRDVERRTLAHAVRLYLQRRILLNGSKTVVFE